MRSFSLVYWGIGLAVSLLPDMAHAEAPLCAERKLPCCVTRWWSQKSLEHTLERAGHPEEVSRCASPTDTGHYVGYHVGGGCPLCGECPGPDEGTWGWDYGGLMCLKRVFLRWGHGKCCQGGTGAYQTDGPPRPRLKHAAEKE